MNELCENQYYVDLIFLRNSSAACSERKVVDERGANVLLCITFISYSAGIDKIANIHSH